MVGRGSVLILCLSAAGCGTSERLPDPISLKDAESLEAEGKPGEAVFAYAKLLPGLRDRDDFEAQIARARIYETLERLRAWKWPDFRSRFPSMGPLLRKNPGAAFLARSARESVLIMSGVGSEEARAESSSRLAGLFLRKVRDPSLRIRSLGDSFLEKILLLEVAGIYEAHHLLLVPTDSTTRLVRIFRALAESFRELAGRTGARPFAVERWRGLSEEYENRVELVEKGRGLPDPERREKRHLHLSLRRHLKEGTWWADRATLERTSKGDRKQCERAYRNALRHLLFSGELLSGKEPEFDNVLSSMPVVLRGWETVCFEEP